MLLTEIDKSKSAKIYVRQVDNDKYFDQKLPTWRDGFCYITRKVNFTPDPQDIYLDGEYGLIKANGKTLIVAGDPETGMEIEGEYKG